MTRRKLLKTASGIRVDYSVYNPLPALGGTHLAALLNDANTVTTINSVLVVNYPEAVVLSPVTSNAGSSGDIGGNATYTNSPTHSPSSQAVVPIASNTTSKNYDNYVFIGASVLGGIMLLGIGGSGLYYLKKKKEYMKRIQKKQLEDLIIVIKPTVTPIKRQASVFAIRRNTVIPGNNNDDDSKSQCDSDDDESIHPRVLQKPLPVDEYNLWGDIESTFEKNNNNPALFVEDLCDSPESTGSPPVVFFETNPLHVQNNNSPAPGQKKRMVRGNNRSLLGKVNQRFKPSKVVPDVEVLETVPEDVAENVASVAAKFETLNIGPRKSKLFLDSAVSPSSAQISVKSPRPKSAKLQSPTVQAPVHSILSAMFGSLSSPRSETMSTRTPRHDDDGASPASVTPRSDSPLPSQQEDGQPDVDGRPLSAKPQPSLSQARPTSTLASIFGSSSPRQDSAPASESENPLSETERPISAVQRVPSAKLRSPTTPSKSNTFLASLFGSSSPLQDSAPASENENPLSETERPISAVQRVPSAKLQSPLKVPPSNTFLASLFGSSSPHQDSAPASENENPLSERELAPTQPSDAALPPRSLLSTMFGSSSPRQDSAPASENENPPLDNLSPADQMLTVLQESQLPVEPQSDVPNNTFNAPRHFKVDPPSNTFLASLFGSSSPRQDSAPASENENPLSETERPISAVQRVSSAKLRSPSPARPISTLASIFGSFSPRQDSAPASENENPPLDSVSPDQMLTDSQESQLPVEPQSDLPNNTFNAPPRHFKVEALVIPAKVEGLALGRRPSSLLSSRSNQKSTVGQQIDDNEGEDMSFDTAISSTAQQPAPVQPSMQLLSKLFGGDDDDNGDDDHVNDYEPTPTPMSPSAVSPLITAQKDHVEAVTTLSVTVASAPTTVSSSSSPAIKDRLARFRASITQPEMPVVHHEGSRGSATSLHELEERLQNYKMTVATLAVPHATTDTMAVDLDQSVVSAATSSGQQPAPVQSSMQLLSKLFGGGDVNDDDINDHELTPVSHVISAPTVCSSSSPAIKDRLARFRASITQPEMPVVHHEGSRGSATSLHELEERLQNYKMTVATLAVPHATTDTMASHGDVVVDPDQSVSAGQQIDDNEGEDMSFDTAISSTAQQPAPVQSSMQLLSKLFGGGDDDNGDDDHINDREPIPTPFSPSAVSAHMSPQTPIWLAASNQDALVPGRTEGLELGPRRSPLKSPHPNHRQKVANETMTRLPMNDREDSNKNIDNQDSRQSPMPYVPTILSNRSTPPSTSKPSTSATQRTTVSRQRRAPSATTTEAVSTAAVPIRPTQRSSIFATMATTNNETAPTLRARTTRAGSGGGAAVAAAPAARESDNAASDMPKSRVSKRRPV